jgi:hypothetical protein
MVASGKAGPQSIRDLSGSDVQRLAQQCTAASNRQVKKN